MVDDDVYALAGHATTDEELVASESVWRTFDVKAYTDSRIDLKLVTVVYHTHIDTAAVGAVEVNDVVVAECKVVGFDK